MARFNPGQALATKEMARGIKVSAQAGSEIIPWDDLPSNMGWGSAGQHKAAAEAYARSMGWAGTWVGGANPKGDGYVFCLNYSDGTSRFSFRKS